MTGPEDWDSIADVVQAAQIAVPPPVWAYTGSGPETEVTIRRNRAAFDRVGFVPRLLRGVVSPNTSTTHLGFPISLPVMPAPVGQIPLVHPPGAIGSARVAERHGTMAYVTRLPNMEEVRKSINGPIVCQFYAYQGDREWQAKTAKQIEDAGYSALCVTVDSAGGGFRDRPLANRERWNNGGGPLPDPEGDTGAHPRIDTGSTATTQASLTWDELAYLRDHTKLPFILKGIMSPLDAEIALQHGIDVIYVSNHGGRRQDGIISTLEALPGIAKAVAGRAEILVDGGFMRGSDIAKALCLGANAVLLGKLQLWGLGGGGEQGLKRVLEILQKELSWTMSAIGANTVADLTPDLLVPTFEPPEAPWPVVPMDLLRYRQGSTGPF